MTKFPIIILTIVTLGFILLAVTENYLPLIIIGSIPIVLAWIVLYVNRKRL